MKQNKIVIPSNDIKLIIGLGNPGSRFIHTRHNIGFRVVEAFADTYAATWREIKNMMCTSVMIDNCTVELAKPLTYMNNSGEILPYFTKKGIKANHVCVVHDELEKKYGTLSFKVGGSHRGHNGLKSIMSFIGADFVRLRVGIGRPDSKDDVSNYVLRPFAQEEEQKVDDVIERACDMLERLLIK